ncbi:MAG: hypothetical protein DRP66_10235 [Planctomycetota bacterium]|nr:MAG: hypothetical protein DRP66_10235 [Planctomycetota bacterium]
MSLIRGSHGGKGSKIMKVVCTVSLVLAVSALTGCGEMEEKKMANQSLAPGQHDQLFDKTISQTMTMKYLLYLPADYDKSDSEWPLILKVDESRIYLTGLSMGGYGSWSLGCDHPERFAAIAPICGGGEPFFARKLKNTPIWAFHGGKDNTVPLKKSEDMVIAVKKAGGDAKLTVYPQAGHDSWTETYNNPEFYEWFLKHSKQ